MPRYTYKCRDCQHTTEVQYQKHEDVIPRIACAWCDGPMEKQPSAPNFTVQGFSEKNGYSK